MLNPLDPKAPPQFGTAEYAGQAGKDVCKFCNQPLMGSYFRVNRSIACAACVEKVRQQIPQDSHAAFTRALIFGAGGAIVGLILYAAVGIITGLMIGYVSLAVGYIVGKAMRKGSGGIGGRRYQITAALLTYAAVSMAAVPIEISQTIKHQKATQSRPSANVGVPRDQDPGTISPDPNPAPSQPRNHSGAGAALFTLVLMGLVSPFLELTDPLHGLIGLVILFVGIQIAWRTTAGISLSILGPFKLSPAAPNAGGPNAAV